MDSDTDSDLEMLPGWEKQFSDGPTIYFNHINRSSLLISPLKALDLKISAQKDVKEHFLKPDFYKFVQKYDSFSTSEQVISNTNFKMKTAIIVGGCSGIGMEIVHQLINRNCSIILGSPNITNCSTDLKEKIGQENFKSNLKMFDLDLASFKSVQYFCEFIIKIVKNIDLIILSAGVMSPPYTITKDGFESTFQINVLSQFYLLETMLEHYAVTNGECRVVWITCESHRAIKIFNTSYLEPSIEDYDGLYSYALSQLCRILIIRQLKMKWEVIPSTKKLLFFCCHPGNLVNGTRITRYHRFLTFVYWLFSPFTKNLSQAAATPLLCCVSSSVKRYSGFYFNNGCICEPSEIGSNKNNGQMLLQYLTEKIKSITSTMAE